MIKRLLLTLSLGWGASQEVRSIEATSPTYVFGDVMRLNESLDMAEYGPKRSFITQCGNVAAFCWASDAVTVAAPKSCNYFATMATLVADGFAVRRIGRIKYAGFFEKPETAIDVMLLSVIGRQDEVIGYSPRSGVLFIISDARPGARLATDLMVAAKSRSLQEAFDARSASLLRLHGPDRLFACEK